MVGIGNGVVLPVGRARAGFTQAGRNAVTELPLAAPFDAIVCRWGVTSLPDPERTLTSLRALLTPTGVFATAVWEAGPAGRPLAHLATALADELFDPPPSPARSATREASVQPTLVDVLRGAGFTAVHAEMMTIRFAWQSPADCAQYLRDVSPDLRTRVAAQPAAMQAAYWQRFTRRLEPYVTINGRVEIPNVTICAAGRR